MLGLGLPIRINKRASGGSPTPPPSRDADTTAFMNAISIPDDSTLYYSGTPQEITGEAMWDAVDTCVKALKTDNLWTPLKAFYPFVGGTASAHERNLKDPADTNAAHRIIWGGGVTHSATGAKGNGTNGYGDCNILPSAMAQDSLLGGFYTRQSPTMNTAQMGAGLSGGSAPRFHIFNNHVWGLNSNVNSYNNDTTVTAWSLGNVAAQRTPTSTGVRQYSNGSMIYERLMTFSPTAITPNINLFCEKLPSSRLYYSPDELAAAYVGDSLSDADVTKLHTHIATMQTSLFRNV